MIRRHRPRRLSPRAFTLALTAALAATAALGPSACGPGDDTPAGLYRKHCARCHGVDGRGNRRAVQAKPGLDLVRSELLADGDRQAVRQRIAEGEGTMPAFGEKLTPQQIDALVDLSYELAGLAPPAPTP